MIAIPNDWTLNTTEDNSFMLAVAVRVEGAMLNSYLLPIWPVFLPLVNEFATSFITILTTATVWKTLGMRAIHALLVCGQTPCNMQVPDELMAADQPASTNG
ncbi:hypothetical protein Slin15195_G130220 [Septoria linicola]|uniref:Uncharacterized protein n=1 Tax=Septoria linicola TaxID=215465 RepID=A0A9Q9ESK8_9PEZI|nr:hypothetical protein Slin15195_G130220 [Septoria linicola]